MKDFELDEELLLTTVEFKGRANKYAAYKRLRDEAPISFHPEGVTPWTPEGGPGYWAIVRYDDVRQISKNNRVFSSYAGTLMQAMPEEQIRAASILHMDNPDHRLVRAIVQPAFTRKAMEEMKDSIRVNADRVIDKMLETDVADVVKDMVDVYPGRVLADLIGLPEQDVDQFVDQVNTLFSTDLAASGKAAQWLVGYSIQKSMERRENPREDLVSRIVNSQVEGRSLTDFEVGAFVALLIVAGAETTGSTLATGLWKLACNPDQWAALKADPSLIPGAINEFLRYGTATVCFKRTALEDFEMHGKTIKAGDKVVIYYESANFDENYFPEPERFDITRDASKQVAFGAGGIHQCIGDHLARYEMSVFLEQLIERVRDIEVVSDLVRPVNQQFNACESLNLRFRV
ncbi:MAG: cytochrome P450 [Myxococcales bacterium]|nr:cytochrome P450 [Myxococcales bacterium]